MNTRTLDYLLASERTKYYQVGKFLVLIHKDDGGNAIILRWNKAEGWVSDVRFYSFATGRGEWERYSGIPDAEPEELTKQDFIQRLCIFSMDVE